MNQINESVIVYAKPSKRILAYLIDLAIIATISIILLIPAILALVNMFANKTDANIIALFISSFVSGALCLSFAIFYFVCVPVFWEGQTVGKRFLNIRIIDIKVNDGPNAKVMFLREAIRITIFVLTFGLSAIASTLCLCISKKHIAFHEEISSTRVVNVNVYDDKNSNYNY